MKVALCLSGHSRTFDKTYQFWKENLLDQHQTDVFMHLWETSGPRNFGEGKSEQFNPDPREDFDSGILSTPRIEFHSIMAKWLPRVLNIQDYNEMEDDFKQKITPVLQERDRRGIPAGFEHHHPLSVRSMLYKRFRANQVKNQWANLKGIEYDIVIQTRTDVALTAPISLPDPSKIYFHNCRSVTTDPEICDFGAIGTTKTIDTWCNLYNEVDELFDILKNDDNYFKFLNPHKMYVQYLQWKNQPYEETDLGLSIVRDTGIVLGWPNAQQTIKERLFS